MADKAAEQGGDEGEKSEHSSSDQEGPAVPLCDGDGNPLEDENGDLLIEFDPEHTSN